MTGERVTAIGMRVELSPEEGLRRPSALELAALRACVPKDVTLSPTHAGCLLEWRPDPAVERGSSETSDAFEDRVQGLVVELEERVRAALPTGDDGEAPWSIATYPGTDRVDAYARCIRNGVEVFLVLGPDAL